MDMKSKNEIKKLDTKELDVAETMFVCNIENKVFQSIVLHCLSQIDGISLGEGNFIDNLFGRSAEGVKGIYAEQDEKHNSINIKVEVSIYYGLPIPLKAEEIQTKVSQTITQLTGLHVASVHVIITNVIAIEEAEISSQSTPVQNNVRNVHEHIDAAYSDEF